MDLDQTLAEWTLTVTAIGAAASIFIGIAALVVSRQSVKIARNARDSDEKARLKRERQEFAGRIGKWGDKVWDSIEMGGGYRRVTDELERLDAASIESPHAIDIIDWMQAAQKVVGEEQRLGVRLKARSRVLREFHRKVAEWVLDPASFDGTPFSIEETD
jgi:hypothetical protein